MKHALSRLEWRITLLMASIFAARLFGLFILLPVFSSYATQLQYSTPTLVGLSLGCHGLSQALLQLPFGAWSDVLGRKLMLKLGLGLFIIGGLLAALSSTIWGLMLGRLIQGAGAIGGVTLATLGDHTRLEVRGRAMAVIGASIGLSIGLSLIMGPWLQTFIGVKGLMWVCVGLGLVSLVSLKAIPETLQAPAKTRSFTWHQIKSQLTTQSLAPMQWGVGVLHANLAMIFLVLPDCLAQVAIGPAEVHQFYFKILSLSFLACVPAILLCERYDKIQLTIRSCLLALASSMLIYTCISPSKAALNTSMFSFFLAFNILETLLPAAVSKSAAPETRGLAMGLFSSLQFFGIFIGGALGGWLKQHYGSTAIFVCLVVCNIVWLASFVNAQNSLRPVNT